MLPRICQYPAREALRAGQTTAGLAALREVKESRG